MMEALWLSGLLAANLWAAGNLGGTSDMGTRTEVVEPPVGRYATPEYPKAAFSPPVDLGDGVAKCAEPRSFCPGGHHGRASGASDGRDMERLEQKLIDSENLRKMHDEWRGYQSADPPEPARSRNTPVARTGHAEECAAPSRQRQMSFTDIVRLSKRGIANDIIVRQMDLTESVFRLTVEDILSLNEQGVSDSVIRAMQNRVPIEDPVSSSRRMPYRIHGGVGPASSSID